MALAFPAFICNNFKCSANLTLEFDYQFVQRIILAIVMIRV